MPFRASITFNSKPIMENLENRFGYGSKGQEEWSKIVWQGSENYVPFRTGQFSTQSYFASKDVFAFGKIKYVGIPEFEGLAQFLWAGYAPSGKPLNYTHLASRSGLEGAFWTTRAALDNKAAWIAEFQSKIDSGEV